jgi:hypothetical protein
MKSSTKSGCRVSRELGAIQIEDVLVAYDAWKKEINAGRVLRK